MKVVGDIEGISFVHFDDRDVVRHKLVQQIVKAYEAFSNGNGGIAAVDRGAARRLSDMAPATNVGAPARAVSRRRADAPVRGRRARRAGCARRRAGRARAARSASRSSAIARVRALNREYRGKDYADRRAQSFPASDRDVAEVTRAAESRVPCRIASWATS